MPPTTLTRLLAATLVLLGQDMLAGQTVGRDDGRDEVAARDGGGPAGPAPAHRLAVSATGPAPAAPSAHDAPLPLAPPHRGKSPEPRSPASRASGLSSVLSVASALAVVLGLFLVGAWAMRRAAPRGARPLPSEVFEVLGRAPLAGRQQVHLLRCGKRLLLVSVAPEGAETLTEINDPDEVAHLAGLCRQAEPNSATAAFRQIFQQWAGSAKEEGDA